MLTPSTTTAAKGTVLAQVLAGVALMAMAGLLHAQSTGNQAVIYKECRRPPERLEWGRFPECGIDEVATREFQDELADATRTLSPHEEERIDEYIDRQFAAPGLAAKQVELLSLMDWTTRRIEAVLESDAYEFSGADRSTLQHANTTVQQRIADNRDRSLTSGELDALTAEMRGIVTDVSRILAATPKTISPETPTIESLVTRIDALVARVGTVIRELERDGLTVPRSVRDGHVNALELVRESKRTCSTRRPEECANLAEVLDTIEAMREPLCKLKSEFLTQICE